MTGKDKAIRKLLTADEKTLAFADFKKGLKALGYEHNRTTGSHQIWVHVQRGLSLNIQPKGKMAKPYQIQQFRQQWNS